jgi:hypothetical protein
MKHLVLLIRCLSKSPDLDLVQKVAPIPKHTSSSVSKANVLPHTPQARLYFMVLAGVSVGHAATVRRHRMPVCKASPTRRTLGTNSGALTYL